jgi:murein L,D-transpeptidase YafK
MRIILAIIFLFVTVAADAALPPADLIVVHKAQHQLDLYSGDTLLKSYPVALGWHPVGPKTRQGDGRTPEGVYTIVRHNPASRYHLSLGISYPGPADVGNAILVGTEPGNAIMIHGIPNGKTVKPGEDWGDWTDGCIAVSDREIEEIYNAVQDGTTIIITP